MDSKKSKTFNLKEKLDDDYLDLSMCNLETVPVKEIIALNKVRRINLSYNKLTHLPEDFIKIDKLRELDLSKNHLKTLPKNFGQLEYLRKLDLLGNQLEQLPFSFFELKNLQWLDLKDNPLSSGLKAEAGECGDENQCKKCAINVRNYVKEQAAIEERKRQETQKRKNEAEMKQKKLDNEEKKKLAELKKKERQERYRTQEHTRTEESESTEKENEELKLKGKSQQETRKKASRSLCKTLFLNFLLTVISFTFIAFVLMSHYCENPKKIEFLSDDNWLVASLGGLCDQYAKNELNFQNFAKKFKNVF